MSEMFEVQLATITGPMPAIAFERVGGLVLHYRMGEWCGNPYADLSTVCASHERTGRKLFELPVERKAEALRILKRFACELRWDFDDADCPEWKVQKETARNILVEEGILPPRGPEGAPKK